MARNRVTVSAGFYLMFALMLLILPLRWLAAAVLAAGFHELCHCVAIWLLSGRRMGVVLYSFGARIPLPEMSRSGELLCALAGPAGGFFLTLFSPVFPRLAVCGFLQSIYNLLPLYPMDGGRAMTCLLTMLLSPVKAAAVRQWIEIIVRVGILLVGLWCLLYQNLGLMPLILSIIVCIRTK